MVWIYDISEKQAVNSSQIVSTYFLITANGKYCQIHVKTSATDTSYIICQKEFASFVKEDMEEVKRAEEIFHKFLKLLSDPEFQNSKEPVNLNDIL
jgi:hypothetical protein